MNRTGARPRIVGVLSLAVPALLLLALSAPAQAHPAAPLAVSGATNRINPSANPSPFAGPVAATSGPPAWHTHPLEAAQYFDDVRSGGTGGAPFRPPVPRAAVAPRAPGADAFTAGPVWSQVGTNSTTGGQIPGGGNVSGRIYAVRPDPSDSTGNTVYLGSAMGGVWKTTNRGQSWMPLTDAQPSLAITAIVLDPTNTQKVYAATGDQTESNRGYGTASTTYFGAGILYSANGGSMWSVIGASIFTGVGILDLAISGDGTKLYVASTNGFWIGTLSGGNWTFAQLGTGLWTSVRINRGNADIINLAGYGGPWVYRPSTNSLTRSTFCVSATTCGTSPVSSINVGRTSIAVDYGTNANYVYASLMCQPNTTDGVNTCPTTTSCQDGSPSCHTRWWGLYESTDSGASFHPLVDARTRFGAWTDYEFGQTYYDLTVGVDPLDDLIIYFGLVNLWRYNYADNSVNMVSSASAGNTTSACYPWDTTRFDLQPGIHCDQHALEFDASGRVYSGNDGGVFSAAAGTFGQSWNSTTYSWSDLNSNLVLTQFFPGVAFNAANPNRLLGGTQDNGTETWNGASWQMTTPGDGAFSAIDPRDATNTFYASYVYLDILKTTNGSTLWSASGGPTWTCPTNGIPGGAGCYTARVGAIFIAPFTIDLNRPDILLAGADKPYRTVNAAGVWSDISNGTTFITATESANRHGISATTICSDPTNQGLFYVGTTTGRIFRTNNGYAATPTWTAVPTGLPGQWVTRIVCPDGTNTVYATIGGSQTTAGVHVLSSTRTGSSWTSIQGTLPNTTVATVLADTRNSATVLYAATDLGVYQSTNGGTNWALFGTGLPNVAVTDLAVNLNANLLYAATHGRGMWSAIIQATATTTTSTTSTSTTTRPPTTSTTASTTSTTRASTTTTSTSTTSTTSPGQCAVPALGCPQAVAPSGTFVADVMVNVGSTPLGAYSFTLTWDHTLVSVTSVVGGSTSQFSSNPTCNTNNTTGTASCSAFQAASLTAPTGIVDIAHVNLTAIGSAGSRPILTLTIDSLFDTQDRSICVQPVADSCSIIIELCGDVNGDRVVNIGDALVVAQYTVGLRQCGVAPLSNPVVCDVNLDSACNIGDALRMAQCDVGLISCTFTCRLFTCP